MLKNNLLDDSFTQYKHDSYNIGEYFERYGSNPRWPDKSRVVHRITAGNALLYKPFQLSLEPTIQRLANLNLKNLSKEARIELCFQLTKDYGFLYFPRHLETIYNSIKLNQILSVDLYSKSDEDFKKDNSYIGESTDKWWKFIITLQHTIKRINNEELYQSQEPFIKWFIDVEIDKLLNTVKPSFDFETQSISLKCDSLASACMLSIVSNKKHLKTCLQCNKLFYAKRSDAMYCNSSCGRNNQGSRRGKS